MKYITTCCIIDDDPIFIYGTKRIMREINFAENIIVYNNGQEALDGLFALIKDEDSMPEIMFLDLNMPIMSGWEFLDEFKNYKSNNSKKIIIYIISSSVDPRDLERVKDYNEVTNYILKPITPNDLTNILNSTLV
jgi:CheY-like chemotaxis protein